MNKNLFKTLICIPPAYDTVYPPLGTPAIVAFLKSKSIAAFQKDLNIEFYKYLRTNKLEFMLTEKYKNDKIKDRVYYYRDLKYGKRRNFNYPFEKVPGSSFEFTEKLLSSKNLSRYIDDEKENIFHKFFKSEMVGRIKKEKYNLVGFSITAPSQVIAAFTFGRIIKSEMPNVGVVIGGRWASLFKDELIKKNSFSAFYDYLIFQEGETPLYSLINSIITNQPLSCVPNMIYKHNSKFILSKHVTEENMNELPCPDFDGLPIRNNYQYRKDKTFPLTFETSRGCYWDRCIFCVDLPLPKPRYREKNIELIIEDIKNLKRKYKTDKLIISNAVFSPWQMKKFCKELIRLKIKILWSAWTRFDNEVSKELLHLAKESGCTMLGFGLESMNQRVLDFCKKGTKVEIIKRIIKDAKDAGLKIHCQVMLGMPSETTKEALDTICFLLNDLKEEPSFNVYYLTPKNIVYNNPEKYGIRFRCNLKLPFRFLHPFQHVLGDFDMNKANAMLRFYNIRRLSNDKKVSFTKMQKIALANIINERASV